MILAKRPRKVWFAITWDLVFITVSPWLFLLVKRCGMALFSSLCIWWLFQDTYIRKVIQLNNIFSSYASPYPYIYIYILVAYPRNVAGVINVNMIWFTSRGRLPNNYHISPNRHGSSPSLVLSSNNFDLCKNFSCKLRHR